LKMRSDAQKQAHEFLEEEAAEESVKPGAGDGRFSYDDADSDEPERHRQTSALMRNSLSLTTGGELAVPNQQHGAGSSQSPVKRPENLE
jgi:hypothetical protein